MPAQEIDVREFLRAVGNRHIPAEAFDAYERDHLVKRPFRVKLHLGMLVRDAEGFDGGLSRVHDVAVEVDRLAEALAPQLAIPVRHIFQRIGIRHHNGDVLALFHCDILQHRRRKRGVFGDFARSAPLVHSRRAGEQPLHVYAENRRGQQTHGTELREASAHSVGNVERLEAFLLRELDEVAFAFGRGGDDVLVPVLSDRLFQDVGNDEVLTHRFAGGAALRDDVEHGAFHVDDVEKREHTLRVDVVLDEKFQPPLFIRKVVVAEMAKRREHRDGTQRAAAYAQHDEVVEILSDVRRAFEYVPDDFVLIVRQVRPRGHTRAAHSGEFIVRRARFRTRG